MAVRNPQQAWHFAKVLWWMWKASKRRDVHIRNGIQVPPIIIYSISDQCNLDCKGCYAHNLYNTKEKDLEFSQMLNIVGDAYKLGVSFFCDCCLFPVLKTKL